MVMPSQLAVPRFLSISPHISDQGWHALDFDGKTAGEHAAKAGNQAAFEHLVVSACHVEINQRKPPSGPSIQENPKACPRKRDRRDASAGGRCR